MTEQREGERERMAAASLLQEGFDASPIGMAITDARTGHCVRTNDAMCALMGCSREDLLQQRVDDVTHPDDRADVLVARQALLDGTLASHHAERRLLRQDGTTIWASVHVAAVPGADGSVHIRRAVDLAATGRPTEFNLSGASLDDPDVLRELTQALQETGADPSLLVAEVTETAMMNHPDAGSAFAKQVTDLGCQLALDDFGKRDTGAERPLGLAAGGRARHLGGGVSAAGARSRGSAPRRDGPA